MIFRKITTIANDDATVFGNFIVRPKRRRE